jgi:hypothetical protein
MMRKHTSGSAISKDSLVLPTGVIEFNDRFDAEAPIGKNVEKVS